MMYLAIRETIPSATKPPRLISVERNLPEVHYGIREADKAFCYFAKPASPELGPGWEMDETGRVKRIGTPEGREQEF